MRYSMQACSRLLTLCLAVLLAACGSAKTNVIDVAVIGEANDPFEHGIHLSPAGQLVRAATAEGLVSSDAQGRVIPALADRWIVTDDGKTYIFRLRDGTWKDGSDITAKSALKALRRAIASLRGTSLGLDLAGIEDMRDMAGRVVEIRLARPMPHFLQLVAQPELGLIHSGSGAGPMRLERENEMAVLSPIRPEELGLPAIGDWEERARDVHLTAMPGKEAVERFNRGDVDLVLGGTIVDFPYTRSVGILRGTIQLDPVTGLFGLLVTHTDGFLEEAANRETIAMAIDREALIDAFGLDGWTPTTRVVAPGLDGDPQTIGERWPNLTIDDRQAMARERISRWRKRQNDPDRTIQLRIRLPEGPGADLIFQRLAQDLGSVGLEAKRAGPKQAADLQMVDDVARYPLATWFLNRLNCRPQKGPCDPKADGYVKEALRAESEAQFSKLLADAEAKLTLANIYVPFGAPVRWSLVRGDVSEFSINSSGWHPLMPLALPPN